MKIFYKIYNYLNLRLSDIRSGELSITDILYPIESQYICAVQKNPGLLKDIKNQTDKICEAAIMKNLDVFQYIRDPSDKIIKLALKREPDLLIFVKNQSEEICLVALHNSQPFRDLLQYVKQQTPAICLAAVSKSGCQIDIVKEEFLSEELFLAAVSRSPKELKYIKDPSDQVIDIAIKKDPLVIQFVRNPSIDLCIQALESARQGTAYEYAYLFITIVPNPSHHETLKNLYHKRDVIDKLNKAFSK
jgi:hypothetical protein